MSKFTNIILLESKKDRYSVMMFCNQLMLCTLPRFVDVKFIGIGLMCLMWIEFDIVLRIHIRTQFRGLYP